MQLIKKQMRVSLARQSGFLLMEALIGLAVFSIGIFALLAMQASALGTVADAKYRTDATLVASQLINTMWNDRNNLSQYAYNGSGSLPPKIISWNSTVSSALPGAGQSDTMPVISVSTVGTLTTVNITIKWKLPKNNTIRQFQTLTYISPP